MTFYFFFFLLEVHLSLMVSSDVLCSSFGEEADFFFFSSKNQIKEHKTSSQEL